MAKATGSPQLTNDELALLKILKDPVLWAKVFLDWDARWYQENIIRDSSNRIVIRAGRRVGKCLPGWVKVFDPTTGRQVSIAELYESGYANIVTMTEDFKITPHSTDIVIDNGVKEVFRVVLRSGRIIDATGNHPLHTIAGWKEIDDLRPGDQVSTPRALPFFGSATLDDNEVKALAYIIGDGNCKNGNLRFTSACPTSVAEMKDVCAYFNVTMKNYQGYDYALHSTRGVGRNNSLRDFLRKHDVWDKGAWDKTVPSVVFELPERQVALFLSRLFATDGWACVSNNTGRNKPSPQIGYCSVSEQLVRDVQHLLLRFGVQSFIKQKKVKYQDSRRHAWQLLITSRRDIEQFISRIGIFSKESATDQVLAACSLRSGKDDVVPVEIMEEVERDRVRQGLSPKDMAWPDANGNSRYRTQYAPQRGRLAHWGKVLKNKRLENLGSSNLYWDEIVSIESIGHHQTYDLSVPITHNFIANDIVVHNTDSICVRALHAAYTKPGRRMTDNFVVLIITPYDAQVQLIFKRLRELVKRSPELQASVTRDVQNPQALWFANGARIEGFTAGTRSGTGAANLRGQRADLMILDECDYLADNDIKTLMAIPLEDPGRIQVIATSTPSGRRSYFWRWCQKDSGWSHYHYPSSVLPTWGPEVEEEFRRELSELAYLQEVEAEFGDEASGVFQKRHIDFARDTGKQLGLRYHTTSPERRGPRVLGVDWDKFQATPTLVGIEWDLERKLFIPIYRKEIARTDFSLDAAVTEIIDSDREFNWDFIYVDRGYGEHQVETLRKYGLANPRTNLHKKVQGVHFGDKVEVPDPHTKQKEKKHFKPFAVNNMALIFERLQIALVPDDRKLIEQIEEYRVESVGVSGQPTYSSKNEHFVDALMLALYGHTIQFTDITKVRMAMRIASLPVLESDPAVKSREIVERKTQTKELSMAGISVGRSPRNSGRSSMGPPRRASF